MLTTENTKFTQSKSEIIYSQKTNTCLRCMPDYIFQLFKCTPPERQLILHCFQSWLAQLI